MKKSYQTGRDLLKAIGTAVLVGMVSTGAAFAQRDDRPNVVVILADDLGYGDLSCYGATKVHTPNIDRLAEEGLRFTDAHSPASVCTPTRYNLLTGRYAWRTWASSSCVWSNDPLLIDPDRFTLPDLFKSHRYRTACIGKWHLGFGEPGMPGWNDVLGPDYNRELRPGPCEVGFDYFWGIPHVGQLPHVIIENHRVLGLSPDDPMRMLPDKRPGFEKNYLERPRLGLATALGVEGGRSARYEHEELAIMMTERAVEWIHEQSADQPFFLYFAHRNIHGPIRPNKRFRDKSSIGAYGDFLMELDWSVGELLGALEAKGLTDNTLVMFSSDNGAIQTYREVVRSATIRGHKLNGPLRGQKTDVYEGGTRIPLIARWPGRIRAGSRSGAIVDLTDLLATFADFFGVDLPADAGEDSFSFLGALLDTRPRQVVRQALVSDSFWNTYAIRRGDWKLILSQTSGGVASERIPYDPDKPPGQLYHLGRDISESVNEYSNHPKIVASLAELLKTYQESGRSAPANRGIRKAD
ncbi:MAG: arylsulfatase [Phycisphaerales bacterium]|nr:MAG: arylsulfatase [Phycisphaerales bacterium]